MLYYLIIIKEIAFIIMLLTLPTLLIIATIKERKEKKEAKSLVRKTAERLLELADDEKPIILKVDQERLIEKTADEIERRQNIKERK